MCIIHEESLHYLFQNIMEAFDKSKMLSSLFLSRVGCLICTCKKDLYYDSKTLISTQRSLYQWFDESLVDSLKAPIQIERLNCFKTIVDDLKQNGHIDSGTKITFLRLLKDLDSFNYSKLRKLAEKTTSIDHPPPTAATSTTTNYSSSKDTTSVSVSSESSTKRLATLKVSNLFFCKLVILKFDLKFCSAKEFIDQLNSLDNGALKYIELTNKCKITLRDLDHLSIRNFMGEVEVTIEAKTEKNLYRAELNLKRLADSIHYRLAKKIPSCDTVCGGGAFNNLKILLQSPPQSVLTTPNDSSISFSSSNFNTTTTTTSNNSTNLTSTTNNTTASTNYADLSSSFNQHKKSSPKSTTNKKQQQPKKSVKNNKSSNNNSSTLNETSSSQSSSSEEVKKSQKGSKKNRSKKSENKKEEDSILDFSRNSVGSTTTPLTSSPVSSASGRSLQRFKLESGKSEAGKKSQPKKKENASSKKSVNLNRKKSTNVVKV